MYKNCSLEFDLPLDYHHLLQRNECDRYNLNAVNKLPLIPKKIPNDSVDLVFDPRLLRCHLLILSCLP